MTPALASADEYRAAIKDLLKEATDQYGYSLTAFLNKASLDTLTYIHDALAAGDKPEHMAGQVACLMNDKAEDHLMVAYIHLYKVLSRTHQDMRPVADLRGALDSGTNPAKGYDRHDPARVTSVRNLYRFIRQTEWRFCTSNHITGVTDNGGPARTYPIENPVIADFIISNPKQTTKVIKLAKRFIETTFQEIIEFSAHHPEQFDTITEIMAEHPERLHGRDPRDINVILEASRDWTAMSEGLL
jgi:hypothetical protein